LICNEISNQNSETLQYIESIFKIPKFIIKPRYSHSEIKKLQSSKYNLLIELDISIDSERAKGTNKFIKNLNKYISTYDDENFDYTGRAIDNILKNGKYDNIFNIEKIFSQNKHKSKQLILADMFFIYDKYTNNQNLKMNAIADYRGSTQYKTNNSNKKNMQYKGSLNRYYNDNYPEKKYKSISTDTAIIYLTQIKNIMKSLAKAVN